MAAVDSASTPVKAELGDNSFDADMLVDDDDCVALGVMPPPAPFGSALSPPPSLGRASSPDLQMDGAKSRAAPKSAASRSSGSSSGKKSAEPAPCRISQKLFPVMPKKGPYCYTHKESVERARAQAKEQGGDYLEQLKEKENSEDTLAWRKFIMDFERSCPGRGRGKPRSKYNFVTLVETWRSESKAIKETKKKMMDYIDFVVWARDKRMMNQERIDKLWCAMLDNPKVKKDKNGCDADGNADTRCEVVKGDYNYEQRLLAHSKEMQAEVMKKKAPDEKTLDAMFNDVNSGHCDFDHDYFEDFQNKSLTDAVVDATHALEPSKGIKRGGPADDSKQAQKEKKKPNASAMVNSRASALVAIKKFMEDEKYAAAKATEEADAALQAVADEKNSENKASLEFQQSILTARVAMLREYWSEKAVEELGKGTSAESLKLLPVTIESLTAARTVNPDRVLDCADGETLKDTKASLMQTLQGPKHLRTAVSQSARELTRAQGKATEKVAKAQAQRAQDDVKKALAQAKMTARKGAVAKNALDAVALFSLGWEDLVKKGYLTGLEKTGMGNAADGRDSVMFAAPPELLKFVAETNSVTDFVARFVQHAPLQGTTKSHGRAVGPVKASLDFAAELKLNLRKCVSSGPEEAAADAQIVFATSTYWNMPGMMITYMERSLCGCVRFQMHGESEVLLLPIDALTSVWSDVDMSKVVYEKVKQLREADIATIFKDKRATRVVLPSSTVLIVPPATLIAEKSLNGGASYGFRLPVLHATHETVWTSAFEHTAKTYEDHPHMPQMNIISKSYKQMSG